MRETAILLFAFATTLVGSGVETAGLRQDLDRARQLIDDGSRALEGADVATAEQRFQHATRLAPELALGWLGLCRVSTNTRRRPASSAGRSQG